MFVDVQHSEGNGASKFVDEQLFVANCVSMFVDVE